MASFVCHSANSRFWTLKTKFLVRGLSSWSWTKTSFMWIYIKFVWPAEEHAVFLYFAVNFAWENAIFIDFGENLASGAAGPLALVSGSWFLSWEASSSNWDHWLWVLGWAMPSFTLGREVIASLWGFNEMVFPVHLVNPAASLIDIPISWGDWIHPVCRGPQTAPRDVGVEFSLYGLEGMNLLVKVCYT